MFLLYSVEIIMTGFFLALPLQPMILTPSYERKFQHIYQLLETDKKITMGKSGKKLGEIGKKGKIYSLTVVYEPVLYILIDEAASFAYISLF